MEDRLLKETWIFEFSPDEDQIHRLVCLTGFGYSRFRRLITYAHSAGVIDYASDKITITFYKNRFPIIEQSLIYKEIRENYPSSTLMVGLLDGIEIADPIEMVEFKLKYSQ
jgi:hypothetical protein